MSELKKLYPGRTGQKGRWDGALRRKSDSGVIWCCGHDHLTGSEAVKCAMAELVRRESKDKK
jgi:hypothetical protein